MSTPVFLHGLSLINALGSGPAEVAAGLLAGSTAGMGVDRDSVPGRAIMVGRISRELAPLASPWDCRNQRLLAQALTGIQAEIERVLARFGRHRVGIVLGTSTSGIAEGEAALAAKLATGAFPPGFDYRAQEMGAPAAFLAEHLGLGGPAYTVSTACTSSAKAFASARRLLAAGFCDAVIVGGVDTLCRLTLAGFAALESTSEALCQPFSRNRRGINIGEAAALTVLSREESPLALVGVGESSDAHHISAPDPAGRGAEAAMRAALADAGLAPGAIAYLNLHGTATPLNDAMEAAAVARVFGLDTPASSTKPLTGHTLGAAGATELLFCALALSGYNDAQRLPPHIHDGQSDPALPAIRLATANDRLATGACAMMSNSFAFGGSNASLILARI